MAGRNVCSGNKEFFRKRIVIIGAGIAGLACANRLRQLGFKNVIILEARNRFGGRINSITNGSTALEMGAQWIHGQENNIIYQIAESKGLINTEAFNYMDAIKHMNNICNEERFFFFKLFNFLDEKVNTISESLISGISVSEYLDDQFRSFVINYDSSCLDCFTKAYEWYCKFLLEINGCHSLSHLSLKLLNNYKECEGDPHVELKNGYNSVLDIFLNLITPWILKNKYVVKIDWSDYKESETSEYDLAKNYKSIKVHCEDGDMFLAHHVVITIPLGFLKKHYQTLFNPPLCISKSRAIQCIGFGTVNKIYLQFEEPFWEEPAAFLIFPHHLSNDILLKDSSQCKAPLKHWTHSINRFAYTSGNPNMLCGWIAGEGASVMESLSDHEVIADCMGILENVMGKKLPLPVKMLRSSWYTDPYSCGSYSHLTMECEKHGLLPSVLAEPEYASTYCEEHPILMFAGEATHDCYFSTVHGAYETGLREAERLFRHYSELTVATVADPWESILFQLNNCSSDKKNLRNEFHIVIVGAGIAGLTCAFHLAKNNFSNISIFEAQDKIGGRVSTADCGGSFLELGAQWIHGKNNALYDFSNTHKLLPYIQKTGYECKGLFCTSDGEVIESNVVEEVRKFVRNAKIKIDEGNYDKTIRKSVKDFLSEEFNFYAVNCCEKSNLSLKKDIFNLFLKSEVVDNACDDLNDIAIQSFTEWDDCPDELYHLTYEKGFKSVLDTLLSEISSSNLHVNMPVKIINWNENFKFENHNYQNRMNANFPVVLECKNKKIYADTVIVTASAGFLKENIDSFFLPSLPPNKLRAISTIGFGTVNKIFLTYDKPFWSSKDYGFHFVWKNDGKGKCEKLLKENPWVFGITGFDIVDKNSNIILGWVGGKEAKMVENVEEESVSTVCTELLRTFLNNPDIPKPSKILRSCWYSNPYIRGSYSNRTPSYYENVNTLQDLQTPICCKFVTKSKELEWPVILFSGEATDECSFSSAHGAFNSGLRAAENLIKTCSEIEIAIKEE